MKDGTPVALLCFMAFPKKRFLIVAGLSVLSGAVYGTYHFLSYSEIVPPEIVQTAQKIEASGSEVVREGPEAPAVVVPEIKFVEKEMPLTAQQMAMADTEQRISSDFTMPHGFEKRVAFWLDIYSKYDSKHYVIHDRDLPWIVFDVVDSTDLFKQVRVSWLNRQDADTLASSRLDGVQSTLRMLSVRGNYDKLTGEEERIFNLLKDVPGSRKSVFRQASKALRIQLGQKDMFEQGLIRSAPFIPVMEDVFAAHGLPKELVRIPLVESSFNIEAHSRVGARGVWQIMPKVGRSGMIINDSIDERQSPLKSTAFAAKMLRQNQRALKSWPLTVTSYNHGISSLLKAVKKLKTSDLQEIIDRNSAQSFQFASSNFYACFMAALRGERYKKELFPDLVFSESLKLKKMTLGKSSTLSGLAKNFGVKVSDIQGSNPDLPEKVKSNFKLPAGFQIFIPEKQEKEIQALQSMNETARGE